MQKKRTNAKKDNKIKYSSFRHFLSRTTNLLIFSSILLFIITLALYCLTLPNTNTGFADSDEFILAAKVHGVAHPSGYPLYTMLTILITSLPLPLSFAGKANLLSSILQALTVTNIFLISFLLLKEFIRSHWQRLISALGVSIFLATFLAFWFNSLFAEVFSLNDFFISLILLLLVLLKTGRHVSLRLPDKPTSWLFLSLCFVSGLGLSNQQSLLLFIPLFVFFLLWIDRRVLVNWKLLGLGILVFAAGFLLPYLYLPLAAHNLSVVNFENPQTLARIIHSITRRFYAEGSGTAYINSPATPLSQRLLSLQFYWIFLTQSITWPVLLLSIVGGVYLLIKKNYALCSMLFLGVIGGGLFFAVYSPPEVSIFFLQELGITHRFFLASLLFISLFAAFGMCALFALLVRYEEKFIFLGCVVLVCIAAYQFSFSYREIKMTNFSLADKFARTFLTSLEKNSLVLCYKEPICFTTLYVQTEYHLRPDVLIIPADMNQQRLEQLQVTHPGLIQTQVKEKSARDGVRIVKDLIKTNLTKRPIYVAGIQQTPSHLQTYGLYTNPYYLIPQGCAMKLATSFSYLKKTMACEAVEKEALAHHTTEKLPLSDMFVNYLSYQRYFNFQTYALHGCIPQAEHEYEAASALNPILAGLNVQPPLVGKKNECSNTKKS